ncbi:histidine kinase [Aquamicrobium segne]|uniref:Histidine kinase n=1 Tax=Aquamicrobium segne TaxID=469547 RepID=A0ABW0GV35_9HYPH
MSVVDRAHLEQQTMGDRQLQQEVLGLLAGQLRSVCQHMVLASPQERARLAHGLKGAALGVGAFALAQCADAVEQEPDVKRHLHQLEQAADTFLNFLPQLTWGVE